MIVSMPLLKIYKFILFDELNKKRGIKNNITLIITFMKQEKTLVAHFKSKARGIINESDIETVISDAGDELLNKGY